MRNVLRTLIPFLAMVLVVSAGPWNSSAEPGPASHAVVVAEQDSGKEPDGGETKTLEQELQGLIEELKGLEKDVREKVQKDILPRVREEIRKLREKLRESQPDDEPAETRNI